MTGANDHIPDWTEDQITRDYLDQRDQEDEEEYSDQQELKDEEWRYAKKQSA